MSAMRAILMTVMLITVAVALYLATVGGAGGTGQAVKQIGGKMNGVIESMNP
jgi:hypothetical protein